MTKPRYAHYIWDFDGMLMDTYPGMTRAMELALLDFGIAPDAQELMALMKISVRKAIEHYPEADPALLRKRYTLHEHDLVTAAQPNPGVQAALEKIAALGGRHYVYTHRGPMTRALLAAAFAHVVFEDIVTGADGFPLKPAPDALNTLCARHGIDKRTALMSGDREVDVLSAHNAGMAGCLYDPEGFYNAFETPLRVKSMAEFVERFVDAS